MKVLVKQINVVLVNKCSGSCNTLDTPMAKLCVPNIIKRINMKVYNFFDEIK